MAASSSVQSQMVVGDGRTVTVITVPGTGDTYSDVLTKHDTDVRSTQSALGIRTGR